MRYLVVVEKSTSSFGRRSCLISRGALPLVKRVKRCLLRSRKPLSSILRDLGKMGSRFRPRRPRAKS